MPSRWETENTNRRKVHILNLLVYAIPLALSLYGLKNLLTQNGTLMVGARHVMRSFHLVPVQGTAAMLNGLGYIALAVFGVLCTGDPPPENRHWSLRVLRGLARWTSLVGFFWCWQTACVVIHAATPWPFPSTREDLQALGLLAMCFGIVPVLAFLWAMFQREAVKRTIYEGGGVPVHIWWRPAAYWCPYYYGATPFRVIFRDRADALHKGYCFVYRSLTDSAVTGSRRVRWLRDEVSVDRTEHDSWVIVDDTPVWPRLDA